LRGNKSWSTFGREGPSDSRRFIALESISVVNPSSGFIPKAFFFSFSFSFLFFSFLFFSFLFFSFLFFSFLFLFLSSCAPLKKKRDRLGDNNQLRQGFFLEDEEWIPLKKGWMSKEDREWGPFQSSIEQNRIFLIFCMRDPDLKNRVGEDLFGWDFFPKVGLPLEKPGQLGDIYFMKDQAFLHQKKRNFNRSYSVFWSNANPSSFSRRGSKGYISWASRRNFSPRGRLLSLICVIPI